MLHVNVYATLGDKAFEYFMYYIFIAVLSIIFKKVRRLLGVSYLGQN